MKKSLLIASIIFSAAFFLVTLGVRNPSLDPSRGPKQRPRAVIESLEKAPLVVCCDQQFVAEPTPSCTVVAPSEVRTPFRLIVSRTPSVVRHSVPSRASPALLSGLA